MDWINILALFLTLLAGFLFIIFVILLLKRLNDYHSNLFQTSEIIKDIPCEILPDKISQVPTKTEQIQHHKINKNRFKIKFNPFKDNFFYFRDFIRDLTRFGKKRQQKINIVYMDERGDLFPTTAYLQNENLEFFIGGLQIFKGIKKALKRKMYVGGKLYYYYFFPFNFHENTDFSKEVKIKINELEADRERIIENDLIKTAIEMSDTQAGIFRTGVIAALAGGVAIGSGFTLMLFIIF